MSTSGGRHASSRSPEQRKAQRAQEKAARLASQREYWARQDRQTRLAAGTHEKLGSRGFTIQPPLQRGDPWQVYREDGKNFLGENIGGHGFDIGGGRAMYTRAAVVQFANLVAKYPGKITPRSRVANDALVHRRHERNLDNVPTEYTRRGFAGARDELKEAGLLGAPQSSRSRKKK